MNAAAPRAPAVITFPIAAATDALPRALAVPLEIAARAGEIWLGAGHGDRAALVELVKLPRDWRARADAAARIDPKAPVLAAELAVQTAAARRGIATMLAEATRDKTRANAAALAPRFVRLAALLFARASADVAAVYPLLVQRADAFGNALAIAAGAARDAQTLAIAHRDARIALDWISALPASEHGMRRAMLAPLARALVALQPANAGAKTAVAAAVSRVAERVVGRALVGNNAALSAALAGLFSALPPAAAPVRVYPPDEPDDAQIARAIARGEDVLAATQSPTGSWHGDYGGPLFLLPMYVGTCHAIGHALDADTTRGMVAYVTAQQNPDGGWGLDVEGDSHVFTSVLNYVALRLLGVPAADPRAAAARAWFLPRGGALASASWGKFFLAVLGLYDYAGLAPVPPELWLVPESLPVHPSHMWCHARMVYLPMSYLYGARAVVGRGAIYDELRAELYAEPYDQIDWPAARTRIAPDDDYKPHGRWLDAAHEVLGVYERFPSRALRRRALDLLLDHIDFEDRSTNYVCIGPVNKVLNLLVWHHVRPGGNEVRAHVAQLPAYLWRAADGVKMQGYESSELWDTAFAIRALAAAGGRQRAAIDRAIDFVAKNQIAATPKHAEHYFRHPSGGGWPFSTAGNGWPTTDCTSVGLEAAICADALGLGGAIGDDRRGDAVARILSWQNADGGWASYEPTRGPRWLERLNPSEVFGEIMIDRSYVECTSACMQAMHAFAPAADPVTRTAIANASARGTEFLLRAQGEDGGFEGSWGVCFTYGAWFGISGLALAAGDDDDARARQAIDRACAFLTAHQQVDGGWGETVEACRLRRYVHSDGGQAVMTSWALLALVAAGRVASAEVDRGVAFLVARQQQDGRWPAEHIAGVFNHTCAIHYDAYLRVFPVWALAAVTRARSAA